MIAALAAVLLLTPPADQPSWPQGRLDVHVPFERRGGAPVGHATVYLPPGYDDNETQRYPLIVLLHGLGGHDDSWITHGKIDRELDLAIHRKRIQPVIVVIPDGGNGYWTDWVDDLPEHRFGSLVEPDTRVWAEKTYRTSGRRAIVGASMGGWGALSIALRHEATYHAAISLSGALFVKPPTGRGVYHAAFGSPGIGQARFAFQNPISLIDMGLGKKLPIWLDCGADDLEKFTLGLEETSKALRRKRIRHQSRMRPGKHSFTVWRKALRESMPWLNRRLAPSP